MTNEERAEGEILLFSGGIAIGGGVTLLFIAPPWISSLILCVGVLMSVYGVNKLNKTD